MLPAQGGLQKLQKLNEPLSVLWKGQSPRDTSVMGLGAAELEKLKDTSKSRDHNIFLGSGHGVGSSGHIGQGQSHAF